MPIELDYWGTKVLFPFTPYPSQEMFHAFSTIFIAQTVITPVIICVHIIFGPYLKLFGYFSYIVAVLMSKWFAEFGILIDFQNNEVVLFRLELQQIQDK